MTTGIANAAPKRTSPSESFMTPNAFDRDCFSSFFKRLANVNNLSSCYVDCLNNKDSFSAQLSSAEICATANAYDAGLTNVPATWTTPGPAAATPAQISDIDDDEFDTKKSASSSEPTKSLTEEKSATTSEGAAAGKAAGSWLALVGLGIGMVF